MHPTAVAVPDSNTFRVSAEAGNRAATDVLFTALDDELRRMARRELSNDGRPIARYCVEERLSVDARIRLCLDGWAAVARAHARQIVQGRLTPSNVLVTAAGQVKLLDIGVATLIEPDTAQAIASAADISALGVLLDELLGEHDATGVLGVSWMVHSRRLANSAVEQGDTSW